MPEAYKPPANLPRLEGGVGDLRIEGEEPRALRNISLAADPITAWAVALTAIAQMITEVVKGQPPEVRAQAWEWWQKDTARWRKLLKIDDA